MDVVFDRTADARVLKCLTSVDDATHDAVAIDGARAISGMDVTHVLDRLACRGGMGTRAWLDVMPNRTG